MKPQVTIVIPVHNREKLVERTLASINAQTWRPLSVVLVDNGSTDGTMAALQRFAASTDLDVKVLSEGKRGATNARNTGLEAVDTPWVMFFDSDDEMSPTHVACAMEYAAAHPDIDLAGWDVRLHIGGNVMKKKFYDRNCLYHCVMHGSLSTQRYMCRTQIVRQAGGWNPNVKYWNDIELGARILSRFPNIKVAKLHGEPTVDVHHTDVSITGSSFSSRADEACRSLQQIEHNLGEGAKMMVRLKKAILAADCNREGRTDLCQKLMAEATDSLKWNQKLMLKMACAYRRLGGKGAAVLIRPFISLRSGK